MMKNSKRNLVILGILLAVVSYGTYLVGNATAVPMRQKEAQDSPLAYERQLQNRLCELMDGKQYAEAEIVFRRLRKLNPEHRGILRLGGTICYRNGKLNEAENLMRNLLLRDPGDFICRNNYGVVLLHKKRTEALRELEKAWRESGKKAFIGKNLLRCAELFKVKLPYAVSVDQEEHTSLPREAIVYPEEGK